MIRIVAISQIRDTPGHAYYRRKRTDGKTKLEALRCPKRRISDAVYRQLLADAETAQLVLAPARPGRSPRPPWQPVDGVARPAAPCW